MESDEQARVAKQIGEEIGKLMELIQFSLGQNQALRIAVGMALRGLPEQSVQRDQIRTALEDWKQLMLHESKSLGLRDGFESMRQALLATMDVQPLGSIHTAPPGSKH